MVQGSTRLPWRRLISLLQHASEVRILLPVVVVLSLSACVQVDSSAGQEGGAERISVVATMSVFADLAEEVGGDEIEVSSIVPVGGDPHTYEPTPSDAVLLSRADIVLDNGLGLSPWFEPLRTNVSGRMVTLTDGIVDEARQSNGKIDPHMWMVPAYVKNGYVTAIEEALVVVDPGHEGIYSARASAFREELSELDAELAREIATIPPAHRKIVTSHDAYSYFADWYGLDVVGTITGVSTEEQPSARSVSRLIDKVRAESVPAVFFETTINPDLAEQVARDVEVDLGAPLYGDSVGEPGSGADNYRSMMRANVRSIVEALGGVP